MLPSAVAAAALLAVLSPAGGVWLVVPTVAVLAVVVPRGLGPAARITAVLVGAIALFSIPSIAIGPSFIRGASGGEITTSTRGREPRASTERLAGIRHLAGCRFPQPPVGLAGRVCADRDPARGRGRRHGARLAPARLGDPALPRDRPRRLPRRPRPRSRRAELAVAEREGDGGGLSRRRRRGCRGQRRAARDRPARRGRRHRQRDRGGSAVVERPRVLECVARAALASSPSSRASASGSPDRALR